MKIGKKGCNFHLVNCRAKLPFGESTSHENHLVFLVTLVSCAALFQDWRVHKCMLHKSGSCACSCGPYVTLYIVGGGTGEGYSPPLMQVWDFVRPHFRLHQGLPKRWFPTLCLLLLCFLAYGPCSWWKHTHAYTCMSMQNTAVHYILSFLFRLIGRNH